MDHETLVSSSARFVEFDGVAVLLSGTLLAAGVFAKRRLDMMTFQGAIKGKSTVILNKREAYD